MSGRSGKFSARVVVNTTVEVRRRLEEIARAKGWSLSKTARVVIMEGLTVLEIRYLGDGGD